jgi:hypothetical protein
MSWDVDILNVAPHITPATLSADDHLPLGSQESIAVIILRTFPDAVQHDESWIVVSRADFTLEFSLGTQDEVRFATIHVHGDCKKALTALAHFVDVTSWRLFDMSTWDFLKFS